MTRIDTQKLRQQLAEATELQGQCQYHGRKPEYCSLSKGCVKVTSSHPTFYQMFKVLPALLDELERLRAIEKRYYEVGAHEIWEKLNS